MALFRGRVSKRPPLDRHTHRVHFSRLLTKKKKGEKSKNLSDGNLIETQEALGTAGNVCIRPGGKFTRRFSSPTDGKIDHTAAKTTTTNRAQQIRM